MNCRYCQVPSPTASRFCDRCGAPNEGVTVQPPIPNWVEFQDPWEGFSLQYPPGWKLLQPAPGLVEIVGPKGERVEFESGKFEADLKESDLAARWRARLCGVRATLRFRQSPDGATLRFEDSTGQGQAIITVVSGGYQIASCWSPNLEADKSMLGSILGSLQKIPPLTRSVWVEPNERSFGFVIPENWSASGGLLRDWKGNLSQQWECHPNSSSVVALKGNYRDEPFREPVPKGILAKLAHATYAANQLLADTKYWASAPSLAYCSAQEIAERHYLPLWKQKSPDARIVEYREIPGAVQGQLDLLKPELILTMGGKGIASVYDVHVELTENGVKMHKRYRIATRRVVPSPTWFAAVCFEGQAPAAEWSHWQPILVGIQESWRIQPAWLAQNNPPNENPRYSYAQEDMGRRYAQISQTLSETSDIVASGYWNRQPVSAPPPAADWSHNWSQMMRGREDRSDDSGTRYDVPGGYDRYWVDTGGTTVFAGNWVATPDPSWQELR